MSEFIPERSPKGTSPSSAISPTDLANFLGQLANLYSSEAYGNSELAHALSELARAVKREDPKYVSTSRKREERSTELTAEKLAELKSLDNDSVKSFLADEGRTKAELLALASARFSMPTSQLRRQRTEEVRAAITAALLHERSIEILSNEAGKNGANRTS
jgi:hypothetical protein